MKLGIFGGTFDPPHIGHINAFKSFIQQFNFDEAHIIPVNMPPHKNLHSSTSANDRMEMARLAFEDLSSKVVVSNIEILREGKSYTADTIRYYIENGFDDIYFLCGTDMFLTLDMWYKPEYIFEHATIVFARREADLSITEEIEKKSKEYVKKYNAKIVPLNAKLVEISSTEIRRSIKNGDSSLLTPKVEKYILDKGLYNDG